jgi:23S rRNA (adenine2503-C2)-methyltransferase
MIITLLEKIDSTIDDVTKYIVSDPVFGKNEVSIIRKDTKLIFCLPTQTNCKMGCTFCHLTGTNRPSKNLSADWIVSVVDYLAQIEYKADKALLISFMGVGEPLLNLNELTASMELLQAKYDRIRFGISTMMPNMNAMEYLTKWTLNHMNFNIKVHLSVHGISNRDKIVPSGIGIRTSIKLLQEFHTSTGNPIEYHYTLVNGVNDSVKELKVFESKIKADGSTVKFLTLSETNGYTNTKLSEEYIRTLFPSNTVEFYNPPGRDVGSSCGMFNKTLYEQT